VREKYREGEGGRRGGKRLMVGGRGEREER
jgi:hypothetical protein